MPEPKVFNLLATLPVAFPAVLCVFLSTPFLFCFVLLTFAAVVGFFYF